ncbi:MAG: sigma-70 family RNA polymerase sigma factor, partial [Gemmatimonadota bacterium]
GDPPPDAAATWYATALERDDLVSAGVMGLMDAVGAYDPARGYRFSTFAGTRIRGAMLDEMRRRDVAPRSVRRRQRALEEAVGRLSVELDRRPSSREVAEDLGMDAQTVWRWKWEVERSRQVSLSKLLTAERSGSSGSWHGGEDVEARLTRESELRLVRRELESLPERERLIVRLYDLEQCTLREIADRLGVSQSRVSQLRTRALGRLRTRLDAVGMAA